ncbi:MAG TPA: hypothetical protein P5293_07830 [Bacteroidales bacterium]|nr:hypothetical protein [Bacteroidales bacterium]
MKEKINIDHPELRKNPFTVPANYFENLAEAVDEKISYVAPKVGWWSVIKPQLALVSTFCIIFFMGYGAITLFTPDSAKKNSLQHPNQLEEYLLSSSSFDFYDEEIDSLTTIKKIDPDQIVEYLRDDASLVYLASIK